MRILHVIAKMDPATGGVSQAVRTLAGGLTDLGVENEIASMDDRDSSFLENEKTAIYPNGPGKGPWSYCPKLTTWLNANIMRFDAVIVHGLWLYNGFATRRVVNNLIRRKLSTSQPERVPRLFIMPHGMLDPYFQRAAGRKLKAFRNWLFWKISENKVINEADGVLFTCLTELKLAREPFRPYNPKREVVVGLGTEQPPAYSTAMKVAFSKICPAVRNNSYFLFLSRIDEKKGVDILIKGYQRVFENDRFITKLVIAGPGAETSYGQQMLQLVSRLNLQDQVFFSGMLRGNEKWGAFYGAEAFVLPSHQENFGIAIVEALACRKPVIISNQVNIWQEIQQAEAGLVGNDSEDGVVELFKAWKSQSNEEKARIARNAEALYKRSFAVAPVAATLLKAVTLA